MVQGQGVGGLIPRFNFDYHLLIVSAIVVTTSSRKERLEGYLNVGDIHLTHDDVKAIDHAGAKGELWDERKTQMAKVGKLVVIAAAACYVGATVAGYVNSCM